MAYTERGIYYQTDYNEDADILEDMEHMAESTDDAIDNLSKDVSTSLINILGIEVYETTETYAIGNMVIYDSKIYRCTAITTGEFDDNKWEEVSIRELIDEKYFKPNRGIPKSDLSSEVKTILEKSENKDNKVTELTEESTDEQYPSAKAVYDENKALKTQVNTLKEITSQMPQVSDSGEEAYLADTIKAPFEKFEVKGHSEQESTTGKNKIDYTKAKSGGNTTVTLIKDGFNAKGYYAGQIVVEGLEKNTDYYLSYIRETISGNATSISVYAGTTQTTVIKSFNNTGIFNTGNNTTVNIWFYVSDGTGIGEANFTNIQLEQGSTPSSYESYTGGQPAPSPSYPYTIKSCGENGTINEKVENSNLAKPVAKTAGNCTTVVNADGSVNINGRENGSFLFTEPININSGEKIYIKLVTNATKPNDLLFNLWATNRNSDAKANMNYNQVYEYTSNIDDKLSPYFWSTGINVDFDFIIIVSKNPITEEYPYRSQNISIPVQAPFRSVGEVEDEFVIKSDGKKYERHYISYIASYNGETLPQDVYNEDGGIKYCNEKSMSTTGQFSTGASVQYVAITPTDLLCTQLQSDILDSLTEDTITYKGGTYITSPDEVKPRIKVSGLKDLNTMYNDFETRLEILESQS